MNRQKAFDDAFKGLWEQNGLSTDGNKCCLYRGDNGCKCGIGFLIPDDKYSPDMDTLYPKIVTQNTRVRRVIAEEYGKFEKGDIEFLEDIQHEMHDSFLNVNNIEEPFISFRRYLNYTASLIAKRYGLNFVEPEAQLIYYSSRSQSHCPKG